MSSLEQINARKAELINQSSDQRLEIARVYYQWQARSQVARQVGGFLKNPFVLAGLGVVLLKLPWRGAWRMSGWLWKTWKIFKMVRRFI